MNKIALLIALLVAIIIVVFVIYTYTGTTIHTLEYESTTLYSGKNLPIYSSDGIERIVYNKDNGTWEYNTELQLSKLITNKIPKGLAYDGNYFIMIDQQGTLYQINSQGTITPTESGYTKLYDTTDGYLLSTADITTVTGPSGSTTRNNGNYGLIQLTSK